MAALNPALDAAEAIAPANHDLERPVSGGVPEHRCRRLVDAAQFREAGA